MKPFLIFVFAALVPLAALATDAPAEPEPTAEDLAPGTEAMSDAATTDTTELPDPDSELLFLDAREIDVREFIWTRRIVVVMADTPNDPAFERQLESLRDRAEEFVDRDVVVIFDAHPEDNTALRQVMRARGFMVAIIDKDGEVKARRPAPRSGRELMAVIDRFPLRRQEILERSPAGR
ncbi:DUF4174 domain-containing protein [Rhodobacteraceae bacterium 2376]|uniref:DUF4174 domain-containing protein n=1 Tax=Rhabdonatronobacter sediminivivens TaxID=2743469 RepID=A0A7Z0HZQ2_9RHOB|nr:DUF4174 domain-containing protein [Rhabdonatronobacter sediminivivens]NYS25275.1 DUF4174 domain-containing protein [Rhabdonatronobacter sediminivivens]